MIINKRRHINSNENQNNKIKKISNETIKCKPKVEIVGDWQSRDWQKFKKAKREIKVLRKKCSISDVIIDAKKLYEKLKCRKTENKAAIVEDLFKKLKTRHCIQKFAMAHDTARIIQCMLKYSSPKLRKGISEELLPSIVEMATSKYAHFCILRMIKYGGNNIRQKIIEACYKNIVKLSQHSISSSIIDQLYLHWTSSKQKTYMRQEFYYDAFKTCKDDQVEKLADTYQSSTQMKQKILDGVKTHLVRSANKNLVDNSLIHAVLLEYLGECSDEDSKEIIELYSDKLPSIITTRKGCEAAVICFWNSTTKQRRRVVKSLSNHLEKIYTHEHGYIVLLAILNSMDDTKAVKKFLFDPISSKLEILIQNQWGRKVIKWFFSPGDKDFFHPQLTNYLENGYKYGKKDKKIRQKEILDQISEPICNSIMEKTEYWLKNGHVALLTGTILKKLDESNFKKCSKNIAQVICRPQWVTFIYSKESPEKDLKASNQKAKILGIEDNGLHMAIKKILKPDKKFGKVKNFADILAAEISAETIKIWAEYNRGCFVLINILENCSNESLEMLKILLQTEIELIKSQKHIGSKILYDKIK